MNAIYIMSYFVLDLISHTPEGEFSKMAPFRILSVDIECAGRKGHFPEPTHDPVIQVANLVTMQGENQPFIRNVMTLKSCAPIVGVDVMPFDTERVVLLAWRYGTRESKEVTVEGRVQFDLLQAMQRDYKLSSYSLNSVSAHFLSEQKEDVHHSIISDLQNGNAETRRRFAVYCLKDAYLPQRLLDKLMYIYNYVEMARVTGVPMSFLLSRGQSIKVLLQLLRKAKQKNLLIPYVKKAGSEQGTYEGATVKPEVVHKLNIPPECVNKTPSGETFVKSNLQKGTHPEILEELLAARKRAKADLKVHYFYYVFNGFCRLFWKEKQYPLEKAVLDGRQLTLKISANSVYGFTGATVPITMFRDIIKCHQLWYVSNRIMIEHTKNIVKDKFTTLKGYEHNAEVIYGDTDSVMVQFGVPTVEAAMNLGREAAEYISGTFITPIKLEFEKVYYPYLLISKKRYAGLLWTNPGKFDKMDTKGIETVRRDNCLLVKNLVNECLHKILIDRDIPGAIQYVKNTISDLLMNRMDLSLLVITKRDAATAPNVGDRVPYVIIKAAKGAKAYEKSEDPIYVLENNIPIDPQYYLENKISRPLLRIFEPILKNASKELLHGSHTRSISISTPANSGIMRFAKKQLTCVGCKALLSKADRTLCSHCKGREAELYCKTVAHVSELEMLFGRLWTQCQECQGSLHQDVLCTSRNCPIFYRRRKAQKDMAEAKVQLDRWSF
ncbi:hypothetical protein DVH24_016006 [Malus domestica]|uniref:DNA polymerase n=1 Tax=Malus domestica TaxID=3750 RepID=A0A498JDL4_MALDO|nr:hypothetical protein DVH24_016006 [Malus domestica]